MLSAINIPRISIGDKLDLSNNNRSRMDTLSTVDTISTGASSSCGAAHFEEDVRLIIENQATLDSIWKDLKKGAYKNAHTLQIIYKTNDPLRKLSKMKNLENVFGALGKLPQLMEVVFCESALYVPFVHKLLKKTSQLQTLKFLHCKFVNVNNKTVDQLWKSVEQQSQLRVLEILDCRGVADECSSSPVDKFAFVMPSCLSSPAKLPELRRVVLDECIIDGTNHMAFTNLIQHHSQLQELEIRPVLQLNSSNARFGDKKINLENFMLVTVPDALAVNTSLTKIAIALEDYMLATVYLDAISEWVSVVQNDNDTLTDLRACPTLPSASTAGAFADWETLGVMDDGVEVFSNEGCESYDIGFHVRRAGCASC
ncbi:expressed unknown protein [Seminavis robusta]|uniref:Uncharacterized protein n=1 Tax=Seminavis robusta TaxID=568900 RepID=A0A9N8DFM4_9STRA|nr:expressed unknown protein [Seminavis robusta]|eukprot:Sro45_g027200.1 n/a (370) ;mRNA; r:143343-144452